MSNHNEISSFIWNVCDDVLRGLFKQHEYGDVILPFVVLRRLDCVLEGKKDDIIKVHQEYKDKFDDTSKIIHSNTQHKGIGTRLMVIAENLAAKAGKKRMAVISGVGVRKFYENKLGYTLENNYMTKSIWFKYILCIIISVDFIVFFSALIVTISHLYSKFY